MISGHADDGVLGPPMAKGEVFFGVDNGETKALVGCDADVAEDRYARRLSARDKTRNGSIAAPVSRTSAAPNYFLFFTMMNCKRRLRARFASVTFGARGLS